MNKQFACIWTGPSYDNKLKQKKIEFFTVENGYSEEDIERIGLCEIGAIVIIEFQNHYVIRLNDE